MTTSDIIQIVIALFTGVAATATVYEVVKRRRSLRPQLSITATTGLVPGARPDPAHPFYCFTVTNPSDREMPLNNIQIGVRGGQKLAYPHMEGDHTLPCRLAPRESALFWIDLIALQDRLSELGYRDEAHVTVRAHDGLGNVYEAPAKVSLSWGR